MHLHDCAWDDAAATVVATVARELDGARFRDRGGGRGDGALGRSRHFRDNMGIFTRET